MEKYIPLFYDLAAVILLLITISRASKRGFTATIVTLVGNIAAFLGASFLSKAAAELLYKTVLHGQVSNFLETQLSGSSDLNELLQEITRMAEDLPRLAANITGITSLNEASISEAIGGAMANVAQNLETTIIRPTVISFLSMIGFIILFAVFSFLVHRVADMVRWVCKIPGLQSVDRFLGGVLGLVQAGINLYLIGIAAHLILYFAGPMRFLSESLIMDTYIWKWIYSFDIFQFFQLSFFS